MEESFKVYFVGAGPGDPGLLTLKGKELLEKADIVIYAGSLVNPELLNFCKDYCEKVDSYGLKLEDIIPIIERNVKAGKKVVRLHSGDPSIYSAIMEQIILLREKGVDVEIVPGVSSVFAAAAALGIQLTLKGVSETLIITRPSGKTLDKDILGELSRIDPSTIAVFLGVQKIDEVIQKLGRPPATPAAVVYHASWKDQKIIRGTVADITSKVKEAGITKSAMIIVGDVLNPPKFQRSKLYGE
ncbi:MAG: precorrin-4 C(11)-methyltransferase [Candidatus Wukongarchaeota archaeon]|nr:precorrin-4 C(11)-methyltransferase [Candidatus Wukongarchaeota archaeon]